MSEPLLAVADLEVVYPGARPPGRFTRRAPVASVSGVTFDVAPGEVVALVGESGSGKSTIGNAILGLVPIANGSVTFQGNDITGASPRERRALASSLQVVFQNPYGSLNPSLTVRSILSEPLRLTPGLGREERADRVTTLLEQVGLPPSAADRRPGDFSGGQRQRIAIARALAVDPTLIVCDEPTSALDVSTQRVVLDLLTELARENNVGYLFITHDLAVVRTFADRVVVLNKGRIVESGSAVDVCERPATPYTQRLVAAAPVPDPVLQAERRRAWRALTDENKTKDAK
ncbi:ABC transporter ATP-binding protein [Leifsonia naganoensis]|uniref:Peptide/nickel transport system ATP-binding protein n=1 Tax=Leifsonia naganoensis TaxID=150025 RepID=A0A853DS82_9MICO|nr:ATP-binding cassette domain-containing protein [Leifsonia naganoensis]NYK10513.1 peptide/nickel transport system ATP-binding protein [Leifsonia naganoensis]